MSDNSAYSASQMNVGDREIIFKDITSEEIHDCKQRTSIKYYFSQRNINDLISGRPTQPNKQFSLRNMSEIIKKMYKNQSQKSEESKHRLQFYHLSCQPKSEKSPNFEYIMEKGEQIDLSQIMKKAKQFFKFLLHITQNVLSLQSLEIYHRDLFQKNIMLFGQRYKLIDFEMADGFKQEGQFDWEKQNKQNHPPIYSLLIRYFELLSIKEQVQKQDKVFQQSQQLSRTKGYLQNLVGDMKELQKDQQPDLLKRIYEFLREKTQKQHYRKQLNRFFNDLVCLFKKFSDNDQAAYSSYIQKLQCLINDLISKENSIENLKQFLLNPKTNVRFVPKRLSLNEEILKNLHKDSEQDASRRIENINQLNQLILDDYNNQNYTIPSDLPYDCIGLFRSEWFENEKLILVCYGTGFLISDRILVTCGHSVYSQTLKRRCQKVSFVPGVNGEVKNSKVYSSAKHDFLYFFECNSNESFSSKTLENDVAMILLEQPVPLKSYLKIQFNKSIPENQKLTVSGYPSKKYKSQRYLEQIVTKRETLSGLTVSFDNGSEFAIYHNIPIKVGHSGSPILMEFEGQYVVVGIHTHKCRGTVNSGLLFNQRRLTKMLKFYKSQFLHRIPEDEIKRIKIKRSMNRNESFEPQTNQIINDPAFSFSDNEFPQQQYSSSEISAIESDELNSNLSETQNQFE